MDEKDVSTYHGLAVVLVVIIVEHFSQSRKCSRVDRVRTFAVDLGSVKRVNFSDSG